MPILVTAGRVVIWSVGLLFALGAAGIDISSLIAGLGIGGIAVAMAAKDTLANVFAGVSLFADRVFELGDEVTVRGTTGKVEQMGIRTTRLRTPDDTLFVIPNSAIADSPLENLSLRRRRRQVTVMPVSYRTSYRELQAARTTIREVLAHLPGIEPDPTVRFEEFGEAALRLKFIYWVSDLSRFAEIVDQVNTEVLKRLDEQGIWCAPDTGARNDSANLARGERLETVMREAAELVDRVSQAGKLPGEADADSLRKRSP
jgi:MscS family membrane protein